MAYTSLKTVAIVAAALTAASSYAIPVASESSADLSAPGANPSGSALVAVSSGPADPSIQPFSALPSLTEASGPINGAQSDGASAVSSAAPASLTGAVKRQTLTTGLSVPPSASNPSLSILPSTGTSAQPTALPSGSSEVTPPNGTTSAAPDAPSGTSSALADPGSSSLA